MPTRGSTYAAASFTLSGGTAVNRIVRWTGSVWEPMGDGVPGGGFNNTVFALRSSGGYLYAAGAFTSADGQNADHIARWDGSAWEQVHGGADADVFALYGSYHDAVLRRM
ncbi:MAG: hypothetical protein L0Y44_14385 [Phycisphaerales bacterium]|nr:hypothetical protein [Phycisphaerales bacterium]MCI0674559.1 hypothetical protein [Phycisphaerales bacterium]